MKQRWKKKTAKLNKMRQILILTLRMETKVDFYPARTFSYLNVCFRFLKTLFVIIETLQVFAFLPLECRLKKIGTVGFQSWLINWKYLFSIFINFFLRKTDPLRLRFVVRLYDCYTWKHHKHNPVTVIRVTGLQSSKVHLQGHFLSIVISADLPITYFFPSAELSRLRAVLLHLLHLPDVDTCHPLHQASNTIQMRVPLW